MIELLVSVCLVNDPKQCKDVHLTYADDNLTPLQCVMRGQPEIAKWSAGHPKWRVEKWTCQRPDEIATKI